MEMSYFEHPDEERLEMYLLGRFPGQQSAIDDDPELDAVELHLATCDGCFSKARVLDATIVELKQALRVYPAKPLRKPVAKTMGARGSSH
jgi:hypothetical protein